MTARPYQQCSICIMDTNDDANIVFDAQGVCSYCEEYKTEEARYPTGEAADLYIEKAVADLKKNGQNKAYDCILGLSGGVDSSYLAYWAKKNNLRPLIVHFDNGWNSELAVKNIENIVNRLGFDLSTYVIDWEEFKDLQRAYFMAGVVDIEALTDHAIFGALYTLIKKHHIKYVLSGANYQTECILPNHWVHKKSDYINIKDIHKKYGTLPLKNFPFITRAVKNYIKANQIEVLEPLNYLVYRKAEVKAILQTELDWKDYGGKHYESIFTKFYQAYILPTKFGIDKRKAHLSNLICSGQMTRAAALKEMEKPLYNPTDLRNDKEFVVKKLGFSQAEFDALMQEPSRPHRDFLVEGSLFEYYPFIKFLKPAWEYYKKLRKK